jgi:hypothetical protein
MRSLALDLDLPLQQVDPGHTEVMARAGSKPFFALRATKGTANYQIPIANYPGCPPQAGPYSFFNSRVMSEASAAAGFLPPNRIACTSRRMGASIFFLAHRPAKDSVVW